MAIALAIFISFVNFFIAIFIMNKAMKMDFNSFYRTLTVSIFSRLFFILVVATLIVLFTALDKLQFFVSLFISLFVMKIIEILYFNFNSKFVKLQNKNTQL